MLGVLRSVFGFLALDECDITSHDREFFWVTSSHEIGDISTCLLGPFTNHGEWCVERSSFLLIICNRALRSCASRKV
jgi:hypothetical protein